MLAFNHRLARAVEDCVDIGDTIAVLDLDPLHYMWVDEGDGRIPADGEMAWSSTIWAS